MLGPQENCFINTGDSYVWKPTFRNAVEKREGAGEIPSD
jgi:hypothetical protein